MPLLSKGTVNCGIHAQWTIRHWSKGVFLLRGGGAWSKTLLLSWCTILANYCPNFSLVATSGPSTIHQKNPILSLHGRECSIDNRKECFLHRKKLAILLLLWLRMRALLWSWRHIIEAAQAWHAGLINWLITPSGTRSLRSAAYRSRCCSNMSGDDPIPWSNITFHDNSCPADLSRNSCFLNSSEVG